MYSCKGHHRSAYDIAIIQWIRSCHKMLWPHITTTKTCLFKYTEKFKIKKWKKIWHFSYFCSKQRYLFTINITKMCLFKYIENFTTKNRKFSDKKSDIFYISPQNIDCLYLLELPQWGSSNEYPQSMLMSRNKKNNVYPCNPSFTI